MDVVVNGESIQLRDVTDPLLELEKELRHIEKEVTDLRDTMKEFQSSLGTQGERIQFILQTSTSVNETLTTVVPLLKSIQPLIDQYNSLRRWGIIGSCVAGGILVGITTSQIIGGPIVLGAIGTLTVVGAVGAGAILK